MLQIVYIALLAGTVAGAFSTNQSVTEVRKVGHGPTGYEVTFRYYSETANQPKSVLLGGFPLYANALTASRSKTEQIAPWDWQADDFSLFLSPLRPAYGNTTYLGFNMTFEESSGGWVTTLPFPSGTFGYAFYLDCKEGWSSPHCNPVIDPGNPPIQSPAGDQNHSIIQVPFDAKHQVQNYDYALPLDDKTRRGSIAFYNYSSPGSTAPTKDIHSVGIYLPVGYGEISGKKYPVLYLSHGGGGNDADWFNQGRAHNIVDQLIDAQVLEPTIVVTPNFYDLGFSMEDFATNITGENGSDTYGLNGFFEAVRKNYLKHLIPWVESNFHTISEPTGRAWGGLSLGGGLSITMLLNATNIFSHVCIMSNTPSPLPNDPQWNNTGINSVDIFLGAGFYDKAFDNSRSMQDRLSAAGVLNYRSRYFPGGGHDWHTWQDILYTWLRNELVKSKWG
ncbi:carbohydrate esterase family 1 protein [Glonium stellatum]|uniref:Carbohydrate esterase family 1 protein n=1 Tax=Glonium stellatum TaxID=574774 RepID=A0A8E2JWH1_9PEZI|nr:carbohydrate esterase family 1 protein [Glonium stellatum]